MVSKGERVSLSNVFATLTVWALTATRSSIVSASLTFPTRSIAFWLRNRITSRMVTMPTASSRSMIGRCLILCASM